jgi:hypothetical protein
MKTLFLYLARVISLSGHLPGSIFSRDGDMASTQNLLISFKPIIYKLNYSHVIRTFIHPRVSYSQTLNSMCSWSLYLFIVHTVALFSMTTLSLSSLSPCIVFMSMLHIIHLLHAGEGNMKKWILNWTVILYTLKIRNKLI